MENFIRSLSVDGNPIAFHFKPVIAAGDLRYYVSVSDDDGTLFLFHMEFRNRSWRIIDAPKVPDWLHQLESELSRLIAEETSA